MLYESVYLKLWSREDFSTKLGKVELIKKEICKYDYIKIT